MENPFGSYARDVKNMDDISFDMGNIASEYDREISEEIYALCEVIGFTKDEIDKLNDPTNEYDSFAQGSVDAYHNVATHCAKYIKDLYDANILPKVLRETERKLHEANKIK